MQHLDSMVEDREGLGIFWNTSFPSVRHPSVRTRSAVLVGLVYDLVW